MTAYDSDFPGTEPKSNRFWLDISLTQCKSERIPSDSFPEIPGQLYIRQVNPISIYSTWKSASLFIENVDCNNKLSCQGSFALAAVIRQTCIAHCQTGMNKDPLILMMSLPCSKTLFINDGNVEKLAQLFAANTVDFLFRFSLLNIEHHQHRWYMFVYAWQTLNCNRDIW